jgi:hypothetical protein
MASMARTRSTTRKAACWKHFSWAITLDDVSHLPLTKLLYNVIDPASDMGVWRAPAASSRVVVFAITIASLEPRSSR